MSERQIPEIRIRYSWLLAKNVSPVMLAQARGPEAKLPPQEQMLERTESYREAWKPYEEKILRGLQEMLGLTFYLPVIDATIAPMIHPQSTPLIISLRPEPDEFVSILAHELIHILLTDNREGARLRGLLEEFAPGESRLVANHVPVHAALQILYLDILKEPQRLEWDIRTCKTNPPYARAWELVQEHGADKIVQWIISAPRERPGA